MSTRQRQGGRAYAALDGWRGLCALCVALTHFNATSHIAEFAIVRNAYLFVDFFFVLSGFIVSFAYMDRLWNPDEMRVMVWRRFARLWPLHVMLLVMFVALDAGSEFVSRATGVGRSATMFDPSSSNQPWAILTNFLLLHGLGFHDQLTWNVPSWSISVEFWTYVVFAVAMRVSADRRTTLVAVALAALGALVVMVCSKSLMKTEHDLGFFRCIYGFFVGHLVFVIYRTGSGSKWSGTGTEVTAVSLAIVFVQVCGETRLSYAAPLVFGVVVWVFAQERGRVSDWMRCRTLSNLGLWSYSIYMVHSLLIIIAHKGFSLLGRLIDEPLIVMRPYDAELVVSFGNTWVMDLVVLAYVAILVPVAVACWRYVEMPMQRFINSKPAPSFCIGAWSLSGATSVRVAGTAEPRS